MTKEDFKNKFKNLIKENLTIKILSNKVTSFNLVINRIKKPK